MLKKSENNGTEEIGLVTPTPEQQQNRGSVSLVLGEWFHLWLVDSQHKGPYQTLWLNFSWAIWIKHLALSVGPMASGM